MLKPRIAWFCQTPSAGRSLVSTYFTSEMLPRLRADFDIDLFGSRPGEFMGQQIAHFLTAAPLMNHYDLFFYQIEDGPESHFVRAHASLVPGAALFHDYLLADAGSVPLLNSGWLRSINRFLNRSLPWAERSRIAGVSAPYALREGAFALFPIFSSERNLKEWRRTTSISVREAVKEFADIEELFLPMPVDSAKWQIAPRREEKFKVAFCGKPWIEFRAHKLFEAVSGLGDIELVWLVDRPEEVHAREMIAEFELSNVELLLDRSPERWAEISAGAGLAVHTQFSLYGQPGPYLQLSMARGTPCVVIDFGAGEHLPGDLVFKIDPGDTEAGQLAALISYLRNDPLNILPARLRGFVIERHDSDLVALRLAKLFRDAVPAFKKFRGIWSEFQADARASLFSEAFARFDRDAAWFDPSSPGEAEAALLDRAREDLGWRE